jgi:hypothetical protein
MNDRDVFPIEDAKRKLSAINSADPELVGKNCTLGGARTLRHQSRLGSVGDAAR